MDGGGGGSEGGRDAGGEMEGSRKGMRDEKAEERGGREEPEERAGWRRRGERGEGGGGGKRGGASRTRSPSGWTGGKEIARQARFRLVVADELRQQGAAAAVWLR